jgi:hypothetical protein
MSQSGQAWFTGCIMVHRRSTTEIKLRMHACGSDIVGPVHILARPIGPLLSVCRSHGGVSAVPRHTSSCLIGKTTSLIVMWAARRGISLRYAAHVHIHLLGNNAGLFATLSTSCLSPTLASEPCVHSHRTSRRVTHRLLPSTALLNCIQIADRCMSQPRKIHATPRRCRDARI